MWNVIQVWQTGNDLAEQQAITYMQKAWTWMHRDILEALLLEGKDASELPGIVLSADKYQTIYAAIYHALKKLTHPQGTPAEARQIQTRYVIQAVKQMLPQTDILQLYNVQLACCPLRTALRYRCSQPVYLCPHIYRSGW